MVSSALIVESFLLSQARWPPTWWTHVRLTGRRPTGTLPKAYGWITDEAKDLLLLRSKSCLTHVS